MSAPTPSQEEEIRAIETRFSTLEQSLSLEEKQTVIQKMLKTEDVQEIRNQLENLEMLSIFLQSTSYDQYIEFRRNFVEQFEKEVNKLIQAKTTEDKKSPELQEVASASAPTQSSSPSHVGPMYAAASQITTPQPTSKPESNSPKPRSPSPKG